MALRTVVVRRATAFYLLGARGLELSEHGEQLVLAGAQLAAAIHAQNKVLIGLAIYQVIVRLTWFIDLGIHTFRGMFQEGK